MKYKGYKIIIYKESTRNFWRWVVQNKNDELILSSKFGYIGTELGKVRHKKDLILKAKLHIDVYLGAVPNDLLFYSSVLNIARIKRKKDGVSKYLYQAEKELFTKKYPDIQLSNYIGVS